MTAHPATSSRFNRRSTAEQVTEGLDLQGKTILITGVNSGLGLESMRVLALRGAHVIGAARTLDKAAKACASVQGKTTPVACELSDPGSVVACTDEVRQSFPTLDVILGNAGIMASQTLELAHGYGVPLEMQFATNHMGHFLLVHRLLERIEAAPQGRVVLVSSMGHGQSPKMGIDFDDLACTGGYDPWLGYGQSKLANILMTNELSRRLSGGKVTANAVHPGVIRTNLGRNAEGLKARVILFFAPLVERSAAQGAATQCYAAVHPDLAGVSGRYFADCKAAKPSKLARDAGLARRLWEKSEELAKAWL